MSKAQKRPWAIIGMFAIGVLPVLLAVVVYFTGWGIPQGRTNHGHLINAPLDMKLLNAKMYGVENINTWWMLTVDDGSCNDACQKQVYLLRQMNIALGKNQERVQHGIILTGSLDPKNTDFFKGYPNLKQFGVEKNTLQWWLGEQVPAQALSEHYILVADPLGNVMLYYTPNQNPRDILDDLKHLLKASTIG